jgi:hypothetical protein
VWDDLISSSHPLLVAGYSSISEIVELIAHWDDRWKGEGQVRLVFGAEPFTTQRHAFRSERQEFTDAVEKYWLEEHGISLRLSAKVLQSIEALKCQQVAARFVHGTRKLHAKIFVGAGAATLGSSNFTAFGLDSQYEANARFESSHERARYRDTVLTFRTSRHRYSPPLQDRVSWV